MTIWPLGFLWWPGDRRHWTGWCWSRRWGWHPWAGSARRRRCAPALTGKPPIAAIGGRGGAEDGLRGEDLVVVPLELGDEIAAGDAVARGERAEEFAVEMVLGEVLHRAVAVARIADGEEIEAALDDGPAVERHGDVVGKGDGRVGGGRHVGHDPLAGIRLAGVHLGQEVVGGVEQGVDPDTRGALPSGLTGSLMM